MKRIFISFVLCWGFLGHSNILASTAITDRQINDCVLELFSASPALFIENTGQIKNSSVRYAFYGDGANIYHTTDGPVFQLFKQKKADDDGNSKKGLLHSHHKPDREKNLNTVSYAFSANFVGARKVELRGAQCQETKVNYYIGNEPNKWQTSVKTYAEVVYPGLYDGVDLHTFGKRSHLKYEFHVYPGADYSKIAIRYEGIEKLSIDNEGRLHIQTPTGELMDDAPYIFQSINGRKVEIPGRYRLIDKTCYAFDIIAPIIPDTELIIDPNLGWSSYLGGSNDDSGTGVAVDAWGNVFLTGNTCSADFPVLGGFDPNINSACDVFVAKFTNTGAIVWASYLGGNYGYEQSDDICTDSLGNAYLTGETTSTDFPVPGGFDTSFNGYIDAFVAKVTGSGELSWASYLGGSDIDAGYGIAANSLDGVYLTGTAGDGFPTPNGFDISYNGSNDAFVAKVTHDGALSWASYLGGSYTDLGDAVSVDSWNNAFLTGYTNSTDFPTQGGFDPNHNGSSDVFVAKVTNAGQLAWASYLGGGDEDIGWGIAIDSSGNVFLTGRTVSTDFPTPGGFDTSYNGGSYDAFAAKVTNEGELVWSSFLGGSYQDQAYGITVDSSDDLDNVLLTGFTASPDFPARCGFDTSYNKNGDVFVASITNAGRFIWASYLGGFQSEYGQGIFADSVENTPADVFLVGTTSSTDFPVHGFDISHNGCKDAFVAQIALKVFGTGDLDGDGLVGLSDANKMSEFWAETCSSPDWCEGCDVDVSGIVDFVDFVAIGNQWLQETY